MRIIRPSLALGAVLAVGGCDTKSAPPPPPPIVRPPDPPPLPPIVDSVLIDFPKPNIPETTSMAFTDTEHLSITGPLHPAMVDAPGPEWRFLDTANSSSSRMFIFEGNPGIEYQWVQFEVIWYPRNTSHKARLCYAYTDEVPPVKDWLEIAVITAAPRSPGPGYPPGWSVRPDGSDEGNNAATAFFQRMVQEKRNVYVGWQIYGDGTPMDLVECRLTMKKGYP